MYSLIFLLLLIPFASAEVFEIPGCIGTATLGVNAYEPKDLTSDDCHQLTFRTYLCGCKNGTVSLFSKNDPTEYDLIFDYEDGGVAKTKRYDNVVFTKTYANPMLTNISVVIGFVIVLGIAIPLILIMIIHKLGGKDRED